MQAIAQEAVISPTIDFVQRRDGSSSPVIDWPHFWIGLPALGADVAIEPVRIAVRSTAVSAAARRAFTWWLRLWPGGLHNGGFAFS